MLTIMLCREVVPATIMFEHFRKQISNEKNSLIDIIQIKCQAAPGLRSLRKQRGGPKHTAKISAHIHRLCPRLAWQILENLDASDYLHKQE